MQVPLGVLLKSETNYEEMTQILEHYQSYVPSVNCEKCIPEIGITQDKRFLTVLVGGDYLSVARARGAQIIRSTSDLTKDTLGGILPVAEDWHAKVCFMEVKSSVCSCWWLVFDIIVCSNYSSWWCAYAHMHAHNACQLRQGVCCGYLDIL